MYFYAFWPRVHTKAIKRRFRIEKKKPSRKQRLIVLMRTGKKEDSQKRWRQSLWHLYRGIDERFVCRLACEQALLGVRGCGRGKWKIWLVRFWQLNTRGPIGGSGGWIQIYETSVQALISLFPPPPPSPLPQESLLAGYMQVQQCPKRQV